MALGAHDDVIVHCDTEALAGFKSGKYRVLVATDIAEEGLATTTKDVARPEGRRAMSARDFLAGHPLPPGTRLT